MTKDKNRCANQILADMELFDYLKEKVGERKTKTGAYHDLLEKCVAGFVVPFLKNHEYVLQADQCHVTISDLAAEWHWHRATVRTFLDKLEDMGHIHRTRFAKSVVITMVFNKTGIGNSTTTYNGQAEIRPADEFDAALSKWITGNLTDSQMGDICEQYHASRLKEIAENSPVGGSGSQTSSKDKSADELTRTLVQRIAVAGLKRVIRNSRFDNPTAFIDFFHFELGDDWSSLLAASKMTAKIILDGESEVTGASSDEIEILATLKEPFKALWAKCREDDSDLL